MNKVSNLEKKKSRRLYVENINTYRYIDFLVLRSRNDLLSQPSIAEKKRKRLVSS